MTANIDGKPQLSPGANVQQVLQVLIQTLESKDAELRLCKQQLKQVQTENSSLKINSASSVKTDDSLRPSTVPSSSRSTDLSVSSDSRRKSNPEIFLFPEPSHAAPEASPSVNHSPHAQQEPVLSNSKQGQKTMSLPVMGEKSNNVTQGSTGVSEQYFHCVVSELVKTKLLLQTVQRQLDMYNEDFMEMEKLKRELQGLTFQNENLKRDLRELQDNKTRADVVVKEDSFELEESNKVGTETTEAETQTDSLTGSETESFKNLEVIKRLTTEIQELTSQNKVLCEEKEKFSQTVSQEVFKLKHEKNSLLSDYTHLKGSVKIISTCLQEEKMRNQTLDKKLNLKTSDVTKLTERMGNLRQRYEDLLEEKKALEKEASIHSSHSSTTYLSQSQTCSSDQYRSAQSSRSAEQLHYNILVNAPDVSHQSGQMTSTSSTSSRNRHAQRDMSPGHISNERAPSNLSQASFMLPAFDPSNSSGTMESQEHETHECPNCELKFQTERSYLQHLNKCIE